MIQFFCIIRSFHFSHCVHGFVVFYSLYKLIIWIVVNRCFTIFIRNIAIQPWSKSLNFMVDPSARCTSIAASTLVSIKMWYCLLTNTIDRIFALQIVPRYSKESVTNEGWYLSATTIQMYSEFLRPNLLFLRYVFEIRTQLTDCQGEPTMPGWFYVHRFVEKR